MGSTPPGRMDNERRGGAAMASDHARVLRDCYDAFNDGRLDEVASCVTADAQATCVPLGRTVRLIDDLGDHARAFPNAKIEVMNLVAQGECVCAEIVVRGMHRGALGG